MEEVHRAREVAASNMPPPGDELDALRAELAAAKSRLAATAAEISPLKSLIESTHGAIVARQEEEGRKQAVVEELRRISDSGRDELRRLRLELASARGAKDALERRVLVCRNVDHRRGKTEIGKGHVVSSRRWRVCLIVKKKVGGFFCNVPKA